MNLQLYNISFSSSENEATTMPINWLNLRSPHLEWLRLRDIPISDIEEYAFSMGSFSRLRYLEMLNVPLKTLNTATFKGLKRLEILILKGLSLVNIERKVLAPMPKLQTFEIDGCGPEKIWLENLFGTCKLRNMYEVYIHNCNLKDTINNKTFRGLRQAQTLSLSSNQIEQIGPKSFDIIHKPKIELQSNNLTSIPIDLIWSYEEDSVNLTENPWKCDCQMEYLRLNINVSLGNIICNTPMKYHGMNLRDCPPLCDENTIVTNETEALIIDESIGDLIKELTRESTFIDKSETETEIETEAKTVAETLDLTKIELKIERGIELESENRTTTKNESSIETETEAKIEMESEISTESIDLECGCSDKFKTNQIVQLTKPSHNIAPITRKHDGELQINKDASTNNLILFEFEQLLANEEKTCFKHSKNIISKKTNYKRYFEPEISYQFCWMEKKSNTIFPLNCVISSLNQLDSEDNYLHAWIMEQKKPVFIISFVLSAICAPFVGILITIALAKLFQKKIREIENVVTISNDQKTVGNKESHYETPLPPRKKVVFREGPNCCGSKDCTCYCEII